MNMILKKALPGLLLTASIFISAKPLSETNAKIGAGIGGTILGTTAGAVTYCGLFNNRSNQALRIGTSGLVTLGVGGVSSYMLYQWLYTMTPQGRITKAASLINNAATDSLITNNFTTQKAVLNHAAARFGTSWSLVLAHQRCTSILKNLEVSRILLNLAYEEIQSDISYTDLCNECGYLNQKITDIAKAIDPLISAIITSQKYDHQTQLYEKHCEAERNRSHEHALQAMKLSYSSLEKAKDRWHENSKDDRKYQRQQELLGQNQNRSVMLNIG